MTIEEYFAYVREYQQRLSDASVLARDGSTAPTQEDLEDLEDPSSDEDPFTIKDEPFVLILP
jgi:hypothetical protein